MYFDIEIWISPNTHKRENKLNRITIFANKNLVGFIVEDGSMQIANIINSDIVICFYFASKTYNKSKVKHEKA